MKKLRGTPATESGYRFSTPVSLILSAVIGVVMGLWGTLVLVDVSKFPGYGRMLLLFVAFASAFLWVSAAIWFRESRVGILGAAVLGAVSPTLGILPFGWFGLIAIVEHPFIMVGFGVVTGVMVQVVVCTARRSAGASAA